MSHFFSRSFKNVTFGMFSYFEFFCFAIFSYKKGYSQFGAVSHNVYLIVAS